MGDQSQIDNQADSARHLRLAAAASRPMDAPPGESQAGYGHLVDYLRVLHKRRWTAATAFLLVLVSVTVYTFTVTPIYEARTRLLIEADNPNVVDFKEVIDEQGAKADYYQTQYNILQSRALARKALEDLKLWENEHFAVGRREVAVLGLVRRRCRARRRGRRRRDGRTVARHRSVPRERDRGRRFATAGSST